MPSQTQPASPQASKKPTQVSAPPQQQKASQQASQKPNASKLIYDQAKGAHETAKQVLELLTPPEDGSETPDPLDEIKQLLGILIEALNGQRLQIEALQADVTALRERRYLGRQGGTLSE